MVTQKLIALFGNLLNNSVLSNSAKSVAQGILIQAIKVLVLNGTFVMSLSAMKVIKKEKEFYLQSTHRELNKHYGNLELKMHL